MYDSFVLLPPALLFTLFDLDAGWLCLAWTNPYRSHGGCGKSWTQRALPGVTACLPVSALSSLVGWAQSW